MQTVQKYIDKIRCSAPFRICIKRVVEAKQNQELRERSQTKPGAVGKKPNKPGESMQIAPAQT